MSKRYGWNSSDYDRNLDILESQVKQLIAQLDNLRWIPVEERLPQPTEETHPQQSELVWLANITESKMEATKAWYESIDDRWFSCFGERITGTHWKPIIPPEGECKQNVFMTREERIAAFHKARGEKWSEEREQWIPKGE